MKPYRLVFALSALITTLSQASYAEDQLGRLFLTPQRRAVLEQQRKYDIQEQQTPVGVTMSLDGIVVRSSGKKTVWINGRAQNDNGYAGVTTRVAPNNPGQAGIEAADGANAKLRVGQTLNRATRQVSDELEGGRLEVKPAPKQH